MQRKSILYLFAFAFLALWVAMVPKGVAAQPAAPTTPGDCSPDTTPIILYQSGFESGAGGWNHSGAADTWAIATNNPRSGTSHFHANDPAWISDQRLMSPVVGLPIGQNPVVLKFWHVPNLESDDPTACYDGGILEVSTNGGIAWTQVHYANLLAGPYTGVVSGDYGNPLGGLQAWCGTTSYINTIVNVSSYAGQTVQFRLRLGSDSSVGGPGWDVNNVTVQSCQPTAATPNINVIPLSISSTQATNVATSQTLTVANIGSMLNWQIAEEPTDLPLSIEGTVVPDVSCSNLADVGWLSVSRTSGATAGGTNTPVTVTFNSTGLVPGTYNANLCITSNDPDPGPGNGTELVVVPVQLAVETNLNCISGRAFANDASHPMPDAYVQVCSQIGSCSIAQTNVSAQYSVCGLDAGVYTIMAFPAPNWNVGPASLGPVILSGDTVLTDQDLMHVTPRPLPPGTTITPTAMANNRLTIYWRDDLTLTTHGCTGGTASYQIVQNGVVVRSGAMAEGPNGVYIAVIPKLYPEHGYATVIINLMCPGGGVTTILFDIYIDPSGHVLTTTGAPIAGATVTLYRSDGSGGPFAAVPDGSGIMAPENRTNPDTTDAAGRFGWNVLAGYYTVRAAATGCHAPGNPGQAFVESAILPIPPPVTDLELRLECPSLAVTLAEFGAYPGDGEVLIAWGTVAETDLQGFHLWRGKSPNGPTERLNQTMIPAQAPGSSQGASYRYDDTNVETGQTYWYWLEDVDLSGVTTQHGPVSITASVPTAVTLNGLDASENSPAPMPAPVPLAALPAAAGLAFGVAAWLHRRR